MSMNRTTILIVILCVSLLATGCASKKYVNSEVGAMEAATGSRMDEVETQVEANQTRLDGQDQTLGELSKTAQEALDRAIAAGELAEGRFLYETVLSDDKVRFAFDDSSLRDTDQQALDIFIDDLKTRDESVYIEIQGHTDSTGEEFYNLGLGEQRSQSVRHYLSSKGGVPLHRMAVISYGETVPIADNSTSEGRATNRRVTLVVLR
jgi:outer membrane protein OmpA-like peptidoglycan-associated protein